MMTQAALFVFVKSVCTANAAQVCGVVVWTMSVFNKDMLMSALCSAALPLLIIGNNQLSLVKITVTGPV